MDIVFLLDYVDDLLYSMFSKNNSLLICSIPDFMHSKDGIRIINELKQLLDHLPFVCDYNNLQTEFLFKTGFYLKEINSQKLDFDSLNNSVNFLLFVNSCSSTMNIAKSIGSFLTKYNFSFAIVSNSQTAGRGRDGRLWSSPPGNIHLTLCYPNINIPKLQTSLKISNIVKKTLSSIFEHDKFNVKWPNDIYLNATKVGGVLIDIENDLVSIGIGINLVGESPFKGINKTLDVLNCENRRVTIIKDLIKNIGDYLKFDIDNNTNVDVFFTKKEIICSFENNLINLKLVDVCQETMMPIGIDTTGRKFRIICNEWILKDNSIAHQI